MERLTPDSRHNKTDRPEVLMPGSPERVQFQRNLLEWLGPIVRKHLFEEGGDPAFGELLSAVVKSADAGLYSGRAEIVKAFEDLRQSSPSKYREQIDALIKEAEAL